MTEAGLVYRRGGKDIAPPVPVEQVWVPLPALPPPPPPPLPRPPPRLEEERVERDHDDVTQSIALVRSLANRGDLVDAGRECVAALERHRDSAELLYLHAVLLAEAGRHAESARAARGALYLDRELIVAHIALGSALARVRDNPGAHRALRNAERLLGGMSPDAVVPASDGEPAARLSEMVRMRLTLLTQMAA